MRNTSLLVAVVLSFELGVVTSANSQPVVPLAGVGGEAEGSGSAATTITQRNIEMFSTLKNKILNLI